MQAEPTTTSATAATPTTTSAGGAGTATAVPTLISQGTPGTVMLRQGVDTGMINAGGAPVNSTLITAGLWASIASTVLLIAILVVVLKIFFKQNQSKK